MHGCIDVASVTKTEDGKMQTRSNNLFFTSDMHMGHKRIIEYCERPFKNVDEMNEAIINRWNEKVTSTDTVNVVGDVCFMNIVDAVNVLRRLNGTINLIKGNHDRKLLKESSFRSRFSRIEDIYELDVVDADAPRGQKIVMCHYALKVWNKSHHGSWHLYGHSHGSLPDDPNSLAIDVGVDSNDFRPWSYEDIKAKMKMKTFKPIDKHGE